MDRRGDVHLFENACAQEQIRELSSWKPGEQSSTRFPDYYNPGLPGEAVSRENMEFIYEVCLNYAQFVELQKTS